MMTYRGPVSLSTLLVLRSKVHKLCKVANIKVKGSLGNFNTH